MRTDYPSIPFHDTACKELIVICIMMFYFSFLQVSDTVWCWWGCGGEFSIEAQIDGLVQERRNSSALATELHLSCTNFIEI